jgi:azurin
MTTYRLFSSICIALFISITCFFPSFSQSDRSGETDIGILVVSKTPDYRHKSIPAGNEALKKIGRKLERRSDVGNVRVDIVDSEGRYSETEPVNVPSDASVLKSRYDVLVFNNSNDANPPDRQKVQVLNPEQHAAFREFIESGGGFVGIHSAVDNMTQDSFFSKVLGAYYEGHATFQKGTVKVPDRVHPATKRLPLEWELDSEWYTFRENPRGDVHVLAVADESTYEGPGMNGEGHLHPVSWCQEIAGGRSFYTALGHAPKHFKNKHMLDHLSGGITWAAGLSNGSATGTVSDSYRKTALDTNTTSPVALDVAPDGRVFYVDRTDYINDQTDDVRVIHRDGSGTETLLELPVSSARIYGLKDLLLDPNFEKNGWVYLFYVTPEDTADQEGREARVSRFTVSDGSISQTSEQVILSFHVDSQMRGHMGGHMDWGPDGRMLYVSAGDDTQIDTGYTPIDERDGRSLYDAQQSSANTADLRGSILRIIPTDDGSYRIPNGNMFTPDNGFSSELEQGTVRPEIFAMGVRNPYRVTVDPETGVLYWGDYGPDAGDWNQKRGPLGIVEFNRTDKPGFFGWPYLVGNNIPYRDYDFDTSQSGNLFDPSGPVNDSPNNTGLRQLEPGIGTMITYVDSWEEYLDYPAAWKKFVPYDSMNDVPFPQIKGGAPMQGPVYRGQSSFGPHALPEYYDGKVFIMEWSRNWIKYVTLNEDGEPVTVEPFLPDHSFKRPMDLEVGPDGALYLVEWGSGYDAPNDDSGIYRIRKRQPSESRPIERAKQQPATTGEDNQVKKEVDKTVKITAGDDMMYDVEAFSVRPGARIKLTFEHTGRMPVQAMGHNVVILKKPSVNPVTFARRAARGSSVEEGFLSDDVRDEVLAATDMIGGGNSDTIVFTAPDTPGKYPYMCTFPQHAASMNGNMVVED